MTALRIFLAACFAAVLAYTLITVARDGVDFVTPYFMALASLTWAGQFTLDFSCYLALSALWVAWRHEFSGSGLALGVICVTFGILAFVPYVIWAHLQAKGDMTRVLMGARAA